MGTRYAGTEEEVRALDAYVKLARAHAAVDAAINRHLSEVGLTVSQFGVLEALLHLGPLPQGVLARKILRSAANLTTVLDNLARRGLVERNRDPSDRRVVIVRLTDAGRERIGPYFPRHVRRVVHAFSALSPEDRDALAELLRALGRGQTEPEPEPLP